MWRKRGFLPKRLGLTPQLRSLTVITARHSAQRPAISAIYPLGTSYRLAPGGLVTHNLPIRRYAGSSSSGELKKTPLFDFHVQNGAKMVPFGGYSMPVDYKEQSVVQSSRWTRENASLFDVSHM
jgi:Aminomethyltransferase folate-binding domain